MYINESKSSVLDKLDLIIAKTTTVGTVICIREAFVNKTFHK